MVYLLLEVKSIEDPAAKTMSISVSLFVMLSTVPLVTVKFTEADPTVSVRVVPVVNLTSLKAPKET